MCVSISERGGGERGVQFYIILYFLLFCRNLALNHVNFHFPAMFFFSSSSEF